MDAIPEDPGAYEHEPIGWDANGSPVAWAHRARKIAKEEVDRAYDQPVELPSLPLIKQEEIPAMLELQRQMDKAAAELADKFEAKLEEIEAAGLGSWGYRSLEEIEAMGIDAIVEAEKQEVLVPNQAMPLHQAAALARSSLQVPFATTEQRELALWLEQRKAENAERLDRAFELAEARCLDLRDAWARLKFKEEAEALAAGFESAFGVVRNFLKPPRPWWMDRAEALAWMGMREQIQENLMAAGARPMPRGVLIDALMAIQGERARKNELAAAAEQAGNEAGADTKGLTTAAGERK